MTDEDGATWVSGSQGPVHTGPGSQYISNTWYLSADSSHLVRAGTDPLTIARDHRTWLRRRFIAPSHYGEAAERLEEPGTTVLLDGPEGVGLRTAATMLLHCLESAEGRFEELSAEEKEKEENGPDIAAGDRFLLDLSGTSDESYRKAQRLLLVYRTKVSERGARLAVVLPNGLRHLIHEELAPLVVELGRPDGARVLARYLRQDGTDTGRGSGPEPDLRPLLHAAPMREIAAFAEMVRRARERDTRGGSFPEWCAEALAAVTDRSKEVTDQVREHTTVPERVLLLSAALFSGGTADAVHRCAAALLRLLGHEDDGTPLLARPGLGEQLQALDIQRDDDGRVRFVKLAYDGAVRRHFWANYPDLRGRLRTWVAGIAQFPGLTAGDRQRLVVRFAEQCLAVDRPHDLWFVAEKWTAADTHHRMEAEAAALLEQGLAHPRHAGRIRARIYEWVTGAQLSLGLARVLTGVCRQVLAATHPDQALVRLHHLALRSGEEAEVAWEDLLDLACGSRRLHARLVDRLLTVRRGAEERKFRLLLDLIAPARLGFCPYRQSLQGAWRAVLARADSPAVWKPSALALFTAVHERPDWDRAPDALIRAADGDPGVLNHLYVMTCEWAAAAVSPRDRAARQVTAAELRQKIDAAQGLDFTTGRPGAP
ncbi:MULTISPECIES: hypothetical protein [Streptomyces]|uniref:Uncharacterized protein n=1 Tax=Streptomyces ramulosus TaxID=47762 RepID=A0ABW1FNT5_9ACTN